MVLEEERARRMKGNEGKAVGCPRIKTLELKETRIEHGGVSMRTVSRRKGNEDERFPSRSFFQGLEWVSVAREVATQKRLAAEKKGEEKVRLR